MFQAFSEFIGTNGFMPHGYCFLWQQPLLWTYILADSIIALSYFSIPFALWYFARKRADLPFRAIFVLFGVFVMACGTTHLFSIWNIWFPNYWVDAIIKVFTALVSALTAVMLWPLIPQALALPSLQHLKDANEALRLEVERRTAIEEELRQMNATLEQRSAKLETAIQELDWFSYSVSHDLRSPLRAIDGFSLILLEDYAETLDDEGKRLLKVVRDNTARMGQLIEDILKFSRTGRTELTFSEINMEQMAREVFADLQPSPDDSPLQLEIEALPPAQGDSAMMRQVFVNLLSNALKFSRSKETPCIKVGGSLQNGEAVYYVKDNGVGFDMQYADKLFGLFQRLHGVAEFEGTGIGLAIVKRIITRHGGRVWAEAKVNEGATFYFALPEQISIDS